MKTPHALPVLPNEVIAEILSWLPVKHLLRLRCVCKFFKSLISNSHFVKLHLQRSCKEPNVILRLRKISELSDNYFYSVMSCSMSSFLQNSYVSPVSWTMFHTDRALGSCNGLVCLLTSSYVYYGTKQYSVRFWNPETRLRSIESPTFSVSLYSSDLGSTTFGFGYDESSDTYKTVVVLYPKNARVDSEITQVKVFNMGDDSWRNIQPFPGFPIKSQFDGQFFSGTLNWLADKNFHFGYKSLVIVSLDLAKETYKRFSLPDDLDGHLHVGVLANYLCIFHDYKRTHFVIWKMEEFGVEKSWTQFVSISYQHLQISGSFKFSSLVPLYTSKNGEILMLLNRDHETILYNQRLNRVKHLKHRNYKVWDATYHVQSLIQPS